jgi:hypothetical protein
MAYAKYISLTLLLVASIGCNINAQTKQSNCTIPTPQTVADLAKGPKMGTADIEIISPKYQQLFAPGSAIEVEAEIRMHGRQIKCVSIYADGTPRDKGPVQMEMVSGVADVYRYRYTIQNAPEVSVYSNAQVTVIDDTDAITSQGAGYLVKKVWPFTITSPKNGATLSSNSRPTIRIAPAAGHSYSESFDKYTCFIDGNEYSTMSGGDIYWLAPRPGTHTIEVVRSFAGIELVRAPPITVNIK